MLLLANTTDKFDLITSAAAALDVVVTYIDAAASGLTSPAAGRQLTAITTAATTDILAAPGAATIRTVKQITVRNKDAALPCTVTLRYNANGTAYEIEAETLAPGEVLMYLDGAGFSKFSAFSAVAQLTGAESSITQRRFAPVLNHGNLHTIVPTSGTAYFVYVGRITQTLTINRVRFHITAAGAGTDTKEVGLFSTPSPPNSSNQTLTRIVATGTVDSGTTTGFKSNTAAFAQVVPAGTHLWAAIRTALATTQPTCAGVGGDMGGGSILTTTGGGALTGVTTAAGTIPAAGTTTQAPELHVTLD